MANYREANVLVDAYQWDPPNDFPAFCSSDVQMTTTVNGPNGTLVAEPTNWIVKFGDGSYAVYSDADFNTKFVAYP